MLRVQTVVPDLRLQILVWPLMLVAPLEHSLSSLHLSLLICKMESTLTLINRVIAQVESGNPLKAISTLPGRERMLKGYQLLPISIGHV